MERFVALLRGINVGGHNILPMQAFRELLDGLGCHDVATYIQSGNAVFRFGGSATKLSNAIGTEIEIRFGFRPSVLVVTAADFQAIVAANPYRDEIADAKNLHVSFLEKPATTADLDRMADLAANDETFELTELAFYLYAPGGIGRSKLVANIEKCLGVNATARNWRTVSRLQAMIEARG
jgi:uncharacterized protein (DUF1697 family)